MPSWRTPRATDCPRSSGPARCTLRRRSNACRRMSRSGSTAVPRPLRRTRPASRRCTRCRWSERTRARRTFRRSSTRLPRTRSPSRSRPDPGRRRDRRRSSRPRSGRPRRQYPGRSRPGWSRRFPPPRARPRSTPSRARRCPSRHRGGGSRLLRSRRPRDRSGRNRDRTTPRARASRARRTTPGVRSTLPPWYRGSAPGARIPRDRGVPHHAGHRESEDRAPQGARQGGRR